MKICVAYSLIGILVGGILGVGLFGISQYWSLPTSPKIPSALQKQILAEKNKQNKKNKKHPDTQKQRASHSSQRTKKGLSPQEQRRLYRREAQFMRDLFRVYQKVVERKNVVQAITVLRYFQQKAPTPAARFQVIKLFKDLQFISKNWPAPKKNSKKIPKKQSKNPLKSKVK